MEEVLDLATPEGGFEIAPDVKGSPVPNEQVIENIIASSLIDAPLFENQPKRNDPMIYVGAGPSMKGLIDEIKEKYEKGQFIVTSNLTYDFLCGYWIEDESDVNLQKELYGQDKKEFLVGGTMTGLRIMNFAIQLGFKTIEYYGLDF